MAKSLVDATLRGGRALAWLSARPAQIQHDRTMRLGVLVEQLLAPVPGGTGRFTYELMAALAAGARPGDVVEGWSAWHRRLDSAIVPGVNGPRRLPLTRRPLSVAWERGIGPAPRGIDVVLAPTLLVPPRAGRPIVVTIPDTVAWSHPETLTPHGVAFHRRMAKRACIEADAIVVYTQAVADELVAFLSVPADRIQVVGAGASAAVTEAPPDADARRRRLRLPPAYVLTVSTLEPRKGLDVVLDALASGTGLPLLVVGQPGWGGVDLNAAAAARSLDGSRVRALGKLDDADLASVFAGATALVAPSRAEGFGLPVLEAMAAGIPVVSSDISAFVEVGGGATLTVPVGDSRALAAALVRLEGDASLRVDLARQGLERAKEYSWERTASKVWSVVWSLA